MTLTEKRERRARILEEVGRGAMVHEVVEKLSVRPAFVAKVCGKAHVSLAGRWVDKTSIAEKSRRAKLLIDEVRCGSMIQDVAKKYDLSESHVFALCQKSAVSTAGRWAHRKGRRRNGMDAAAFVAWCKTQCIRDEKTGCLVWQLGTSNGYPTTSLMSKPVLIHRAMWEYEHKVKLASDSYVCHKCDRPRCLESSHHFIGTAADNYNDMAKKGRRADLKGEAHGRAKLTEAEVCQIRDLSACGRFSLCAIGDMYGVYNTLVGMIKRRECWKHVF